MWPTSIPRLIISVPGRPGLGRLQPRYGCRHFWRRHVAIPVDAEVMFTVDVSTRGEVAHCSNRAVNNDRNRHIHRTERAGPAFTTARISASVANVSGLATCSFRLSLRSVHDRHAPAGQPAGKRCLRWISPAAFSRFFDWQTELLNQLGDGFRIWRINQRHLLRAAPRGSLVPALLQIRCSPRSLKSQRRSHRLHRSAPEPEFMGRATADGAGISLHSTEIQTHAGEDFAVGLVHFVVGLLQRFL